MERSVHWDAIPGGDTGFKNWDVSVTKVFKFKERLTTQVRAEFFNILNHPNFANPFGGPEVQPLRSTRPRVRPSAIPAPLRTRQAPIPCWGKGVPVQWFEVVFKRNTIRVLREERC
jgi:hypothetical protein